MATYQEHFAALRTRLDKEIARIAAADTVAVGGLTKLGAAFENFLRASYREAAAHQRPPRAPSPTPAPRGPGEWLRALGTLKPTTSMPPVLQIVIREASQARLNRLARLRNIVAHEGEIPSPVETRAFLIQVRDWLSEAKATGPRTQKV